MDREILAKTNKNVDTPGKAEWVGEIFAEYGSFIRSVIRFKIRNEAMCEDLFQDFFLFLIVNPIPQDIQNIKGFLYKAVSNRIVDAVRSTGRYQTRINRYAEHQTNTLSDCPEKILIDLEETEKMFELLRENLPLNEALAVKLRYMDDYDTTEVAQKLKVDPRSVSRYVSVGLKKVRHALGVDKGDSYGSL